MPLHPFAEAFQDILPNDRLIVLSTYLENMDAQIQDLTLRLTDLESKFSKLAARDVIDAFKNHVVNNFANMIPEASTESAHGKLNLTSRKNFEALASLLKSSRPESKIGVRLQYYSKEYKFDYAAAVQFCADTSTADDYNSYAHELKEFLSKNPTDRTHEEIQAARSVVEKLMPQSKSLTSGMLEVVIKEKLQCSKYTPQSQHPRSSAGTPPPQQSSSPLPTPIQPQPSPSLHTTRQRQPSSPLAQQPAKRHRRERK